MFAHQLVVLELADAHVGVEHLLDERLRLPLPRFSWARESGGERLFRIRQSVLTGGAWRKMASARSSKARQSGAGIHIQHATHGDVSISCITFREAGEGWTGATFFHHGKAFFCKTHSRSERFNHPEHSLNVHERAWKSKSFVQKRCAAAESASQ